MILKNAVLFLINSLKDIYDESEAESIAKIAVEFIVEIDITKFIFNTYRILTEKEITQLHQFNKELLKHKPVQYLCSRMWFDGDWYFVNKNVLIPRSETEELVELIKNNHPRNTKLTIIDIGTGSGCIAISLKKHFTNATVYAMDICEKALEVAQQNSEAILGKSAIQFIKKDVLILNNLPLKSFDIIVSNPPYVTEVDKGKMQKNVLDYEPHIALFENDKLEFYQKITELAAKQKTKGALYFEINEQNGADVKSIMENNGFKNTRINTDLQGRERIVWSI